MTGKLKRKIAAWVRRFTASNAMVIANYHHHRSEWLEACILKDSFTALQYVECNLGFSRWPEAEPLIRSNPVTAWTYACNVLKGRWPKAEPIIMHDPRCAERYAYCVMEKRWPEAEAVIASTAETAFAYALRTICGRWPMGEPAINGSVYYRKKYHNFLLNLHAAYD